MARRALLALLPVVALLAPAAVQGACGSSCATRTACSSTRRAVVERGSYHVFERSVTRRRLGRRTYTLRLEGTDANGAPFALEERDLRIR